MPDIKSSDFVGITATGPESNMVALEVHIFPDSMRGTGKGHYPWSLPAMVAHADQGNTHSAAGEGPPVAGTMTSGTVAAGTGQAGGRELTLTCNNTGRR